VYPDERVSRFVDENFIPVRLHVRDQSNEFKRLGAKYGAHWTPAVIVLDEGGEERYRIEGFLPTEDFLAQLRLGLAHAAFAEGRYPDAEGMFREILETHPNADAAAESLYWAGVSRYKATNDPAALAETARQFRERYRHTPWAKKASVWAA
jgi:hypothetical protein